MNQQSTQEELERYRQEVKGLHYKVEQGTATIEDDTCYRGSNGSITRCSAVYECVPPRTEPLSRAMNRVPWVG